jgi:hypothetical protein
MLVWVFSAMDVDEKGSVALENEIYDIIKEFTK